MPPEIGIILDFLRTEAATYWNWPLINEFRPIYIGIVMGTFVMGKIMRGPMKLAALGLGFFAPDIYFSNFYTG